MAMLQLLLDQHPGPLPLTGTFQPRSSEVVDMIISGVAWRRGSSSTNTIGIELVIKDKDGNQVGYTSGTLDSGVIRRAVVAQFGQMTLKWGETYSFTLQLLHADQNSDSNDFFTATIIY